MPDENGTAIVLKFTELDEFQNHLETLACCLNVSLFEIASVHVNANVDVAQLSEQNHMKRKAGESLTEVPVSAKRQNLSDNSDEELRRLFKHAESNRMHYHNKISLENDEIRDNYQKRKASQTNEQTQAKLAKRKDNYQKRKASETNEQTQAKVAKRKDNYQKRKESETDKQTQAKLAKRKDNYQKRKASETDEQTQANLLKEKTIIKREKHLRLMSKHRQNLLKEKTIIKKEKHLRLISKDRQNLLKEGTVIKGKRF